ncbi:MAG: hypothetical protein M3070_14450 [Actinomycetota bacterium]|nr:hypothetical protein [Actinomycetota bacterium]
MVGGEQDLSHQSPHMAAPHRIQGSPPQARAIAVHHLDCPWRPADIAQREGRILRQGNRNPEVEILRYVTEHSFDAYRVADR